MVVILGVFVVLAASDQKARNSVRPISASRFFTFRLSKTSRKASGRPLGIPSGPGARLLRRSRGLSLFLRSLVESGRGGGLSDFFVAGGRLWCVLPWPRLRLALSRLFTDSTTLRSASLPTEERSFLVPELVWTLGKRLGEG